MCNFTALRASKVEMDLIGLILHDIIRNLIHIDQGAIILAGVVLNEKELWQIEHI